MTVLQTYIVVHTFHMSCYLQQEKTTKVYQAGNRVLYPTTDASSIIFAQYITQGLAEIPDDLATQL
jgi:hypothetical protein